MENEKALRAEIAEEVWFGVSYPILDKKGEKEVRRALAKGEYGEPGTGGHSLALSWLSSKDAERADRSALAASDAARWARWSAIIATIAAITATKDQIIELIEVFLK